MIGYVTTRRRSWHSGAVLHSKTIALTALLLACSGDSKLEKKPTPAASAATAEQQAQPTAIKEARTCDALPGHRYEAIKLPPEFAPSLPTGMEELWFSPGMFKEDAPDYFTYRFSLRFDQPQAPDKIESLLYDYFAGLMSAVAKSKGREHDSKATRVDLRSLDSHLATHCRADYCRISQTYYVATIETVDEFASGKTVTLHALLEVSGSCLRFAIGPKDRGTDLEVAQFVSVARPIWPCLACEPTP